MLVFWKERLVFLATPKTGSTSIEAALEPLASVVIQRPPELKHTPVRRFQRFLAPYLQSAAKEDFAVVALMREPVSWLGSWYRYRTREDIPRRERSTAGMSFDAFVEAYLCAPQPPFAAVGSQGRFLSGGGGADLRLFRYEEIGAFVGFLEARLDCEITLPRLNVSPAGAVGLSPANAARLRTALAEDFALYDAIGTGL